MMTSKDRNMDTVLWDQRFRCCICLDVYSDPVSLPCAHNFCFGCIKGFWDSQNTCECPLCKMQFRSRPKLRINKDFEEMIELFLRPKQSIEVNADADSLNHSDDVLCDVCIATKSKAAKSCLKCQTSYCEVHLMTHERNPTLKKHQLTDPTIFPNSNLCRHHKKPLEMFCKTDLRPVCNKCSESHHQHHDIVPMVQESKRVKVVLKKTQSSVKQLIRSRLKKAEEVRQSVEQSKKITEKEIERSSEVCQALIGAIQRNQQGLVEELKTRQDEAERRSKELLMALEQEISDLQMQSSELHLLEQSRNSLHLVQSFASVAVPPMRDWTEVTVHSDNCMGMVRRSMDTLVEACQQLANTMSTAEADMVTQYAVNITLDPATACGWVDVSSNGKNVNISKQNKKTLDGPQRFDSCVCVLAKESFVSGRCYWEVQVGDKTDWDLGIAKKSIRRKGQITVRPENGFWSICRRKGGALSSCTSPSVTIPLQESPKRVGVFVDYEEGLVSFYDANTKTHIYSHRGCNFTEPLYPYFNPCLAENGKNSAPLMICPVEESHRL
ncbi:E3 ubiquitin-protein ligase TRIM39-like [Synchiropus picturatus]